MQCKYLFITLGLREEINEFEITKNSCFRRSIKRETIVICFDEIRRKSNQLLFIRLLAIDIESNENKNCDLKVYHDASPINGFSQICIIIAYCRK